MLSTPPYAEDLACLASKVRERAREPINQNHLNNWPGGAFEMMERKRYI